ncbi:MAG: lipid-binding SYLF domain-containing protein [Acidobacteria bacterium]|jgi:lipid-binding SYLF domain-containing protein|nr:lipid-binding SYLF domain-containing protein [Acidobacteriota bacterium]
MSVQSCSVAVALALAALTAQPLAQEGVKESDRIKEAIVVLDEVMAAGDSSVPRNILEKAEAIAVFPSLVKAGFVVGGSRGHGVISVRDTKSGAWSSPAFLTITGGSIGFQIGAQAIDLVLVVQNRRGLEQLLKNQFKIGASASVAAGPVGRDAQASTDIQLRAQILSYSRTRGLFAGVSLAGSTIRQDRDANERFYGVAYRTGQIVTQGLGGAPEPSSDWRAALARHAGGTP